MYSYLSLKILLNLMYKHLLIFKFSKIVKKKVCFLDTNINYAIDLLITYQLFQSCYHNSNYVKL